MLKIRKFSFGDLKEVLRIEKVSFPVPWSESYFKKIQKKYPNCFLVAGSSGKIVGYILGYIKEKKSAFIEKLAVHPEFRQKGIGTKLIDYIFNTLKKTGPKEAFLHIRTNNQGACAFYQKLGFRTVKSIKKYYRNGDNAYLMEKEI